MNQPHNTVNVTIRMPRDLHDSVKKRAELHRRSINNYICLAVEEKSRSLQTREKLERGGIEFVPPLKTLPMQDGNAF